MARLRKSIARLAAPALVLSAVPLAAVATLTPSAGAPGATSGALQELRSFPVGEVGIDGVRGLAWDPRREALVLVDTGAPAYVVRVTPDETRLSGRSLPGVTDPGTVAVTGDGAITGVSGGSVLHFDGPGVERAPAGDLRLADPQGAAYDESGALVVLDGDAIVRRGPGGKVERTAVSGGDSRDLRGLSTRSGNSLLYTYDASSQQLLGIDGRGRVAESFDLGQVEAADVQGVVVAPSSDSTDDPSTQSVYLADAGGQDALGQVVEVSLAAQFVATAAVNGSVVRTVDTSKFSPPSPDPSGVTYMPQADRLLIADGEVDEMPIFRNANFFVTTRAGSVQSTGVSQPWSDEPVGVSYYPGNGHLFVSDDDQQEVFEIVAGGDGRFGTSDDTVTHFDTNGVGNGDPEGVEYDPGSNSIWTVDGVDREVYRFRPGPDGTFGTSDDLKTHFDIATYGAGDPEGIAYDSVRDTLVVLDDNSQTIYELDRSGALLNTVDVASAGMQAAAGITLAPGSQDPSRRNYYTVARGVDNNSDPNENDGKMYEISATLPPTGGNPNQAPTVNAGADATVVVPGPVALDGTVSDDGLPNPPGAVATTWSKVSGPGTVSFGNASAVDTSASFSQAGSYVLRLSADDGGVSAFDDVAVTVLTSGGGTVQTTQTRVSASSDDAEQQVSGSMSLTSSDLELTTDGTTQQVVGVRFAGVQVPAGATITNAYVQFQTDEVSTGASSMTIRAEAADSAPTYTNTSGNVTSRATTAASVAWSPPDWSTADEAGAAQRTPNVGPLVQAVVGRSGWAQGNALALQFSGTGRRTAEAFDGVSTAAPLLHVEYTTGGGGGPVNQAPTVNAGADATVTLPLSVALDGTVSDDGLPNPPGAVTTTWSKVSGPGTVSFGNASAVDTSASFSQAGSYVLRLTASDSALSGSDEVTITVQDAGPGNQAPTVNAGADATVTLPGAAALDGTVSDDGLPNPPGAVTTTWSKVSGPGTVSFGNASAVDTSASFSQAGSYVLRLTASDSALSVSDEVTITVQPSGGGTAQSTEVRVSAGSDDAEQRVSGSMSLNSSDLELTTDGNSQQVVGIRFAGVQVPAGATITGAYVQFRSDEVSSGTASLTIRAEAADSAPTYTNTSGSVTSRATTAASVAWSPPAWTVQNEVSAAERTPDVAALVQAVVGRPGWAQGNALALQVSGTGTRTADSFEGGAAFAPLLHIEYTTGG